MDDLIFVGGAFAKGRPASVRQDVSEFTSLSPLASWLTHLMGHASGSACVVLGLFVAQVLNVLSYAGA